MLILFNLVKSESNFVEIDNDNIYNDNIINISYKQTMTI